MSKESTDTGEATVESQIIEVKPKRGYLSTDELFAQRNLQIQPIRLEEKYTKRLPKEIEEEKLKTLYDNMRQRLSLPRIERVGGRSLAVWDATENAMLVKRKVGKFENFGYTRHGKLYLQFFEALYLLEMGRMQLDYDDIVLSIEQAYLLLLDEEASPKFNEYLIYALFTKVGYILVKYNNKYFDLSDDEEVEKNALKFYVPLKAKTPTDCIWQILQQSLHNTPIPEETKELPFYNEMAENMEKIKSTIKQQQQNHEVENDEDKPSSSQNVETEFQWNLKRDNGNKRKTEQFCISRNKRKRQNSQERTKEEHKSFLDFLKNEIEYLQFKETFEKFDIIELKSNDSSDFQKCRQFKISFDLYLHNDGFKKSGPPAPKLRVVILNTNEDFPTHNEILQCYKQQLQPTELLLVSVSESKKINGYLYHFTK